MKTIPKDYINRLYAGWYGKLIGIRYGAPIEGWTYENIQKIHGELTGYIVDYKDFAADDDSNGPMFFLRALEDYGLNATAEQMGLNWLNYVSEGKGFFWWGGYGVSTEHTAYLNLKNGISAPRSGSIAQNGQTVAEQIGGQIFIDTWGLVTPGNPNAAVSYATRAASVSHDGSGIYGAVFVAAAISYAFVEQDIYKVIQKALSYIPKDSEYMKMADDVLAFYREHPENWRDCYEFVKQNHGYVRYPGNCHMVPNAAVMLLSMLYGENDFDKTLNICNMCGWDTDCNVGNVGCIMGVLVGLEGIDYQKWRKPINDFICCSSVIGSLNALDVPWCVQYIAKLAYEMAGDEPAAEWKNWVQGETSRFNFDLPGSTHGFRARYAVDRGQEHSIMQTTDKVYEGQGALSFYTQKVELGDEVFLYHKTFYHPEDFHDSRYDPSFSPVLYAGETISCRVSVPENLVGGVRACLFVKDDYSGEVIKGESVLLEDTQWVPLSFTIPGGQAILVCEAGLLLMPVAKEGWRNWLQVYVDSFDFSGKADFRIDFDKETWQVWHPNHREIGQWTNTKGIWELDEGTLGVHCSDYAEAYAGRFDFEDYSFTATIIPQLGMAHRLNFRVQGVIRSYALGLAADNRLVLYKNANGYRELVSVPYAWEHGKEYRFCVVVKGTDMVVFEGENKLMEHSDLEQPYRRGQIGVSVCDGSFCKYRDFAVQIL